MAGLSINLIPATWFSFSYDVPGSEVARVVVQDIDVTQWTQGMLVVRVHSRDFGDPGPTGNAGAILVALFPQTHSAQLPGGMFFQFDAGCGNVQVTRDSPSNAYGLDPAAAYAPLHAPGVPDCWGIYAATLFLAVGAQQQTDPAPPPLEATISVDLVLKA